MWREHHRAHDTLVGSLRTEWLLRDRERQLASAQTIAHVGSWEWDITTNLVTWSDELCRMYGHPPGTPATYDAFVRLVHPDDRDRVERAIAQGLAERRTVEYEWRLVRPSGELRHVYGINVVILDPTGTPVGLAGTSLDITERKAAEESQQTLLRELQTALAEVKTLTDDGRWEQFESYVRGHSDVEFSHGICPDCAKAWCPAPPEGLG
jgi:PAS domain S-box-containing protein